MNRRIRGWGGFTLVEILVALFIFAIVGVMGTRLIGQVASQQVALSERSDRLIEWQRALQVLGRDIMQYRARGVRDELGDRQAPLLLDDDGLLEFTHAGWRNPLGQRRADLQRVAYVYDRDSRELRRLYWLVLDRVADSEPVQQTLLTNVDSVRFLIMDQAGNQYDYWPTIASEGADAQPPVAIVVRLEAAPFGLLERVWEMPVG